MKKNKKKRKIDTTETVVDCIGVDAQGKQYKGKISLGKQGLHICHPTYDHTGHW